MSKPDTQKSEKPQDKPAEATRSDEIREEALNEVSGGRRTRPASPM